MKRKLNLTELMQAFIDGKKVRKDSWDSSAYVYFKDDKFFDENRKKVLYSEIFNAILLSSYWELYDENKPDHIELEMHDFQWALSEAKKGIPVARRAWGLDSYQVVVVVNDVLDIKDFGSKVSYRYSPDVQSLEAQDWYAYTTRTKENDVYRLVEKLRSNAFDDLRIKFLRHADAISKQIFINPEVEVEFKISIYIDGVNQTD